MVTTLLLLYLIFRFKNKRREQENIKQIEQKEEFKNDFKQGLKRMHFRSFQNRNNQ